MSGHQSSRSVWTVGPTEAAISSATFVLFTNKDMKLHFVLEHAYFR
jgi:hypothetical protein